MKPDLQDLLYAVQVSGSSFATYPIKYRTKYNRLDHFSIYFALSSIFFDPSTIAPTFIRKISYICGIFFVNTTA